MKQNILARGMDVRYASWMKSNIFTVYHDTQGKAWAGYNEPVSSRDPRDDFD
jgi:hypothetical protein